jgi:tetratricopeptide (TPR) repeat protein/S1-C subfamily serine protease
MNKQFTTIPICLLAIACTQSQPQSTPSATALPRLHANNTSSPKTISVRKSSFAIPIDTLARFVDIASGQENHRQYPPQQSAGDIARNNYTGVVKKVDDIAQQITVRIEDKNGGNGSGVIVAREGDTYYVATAAHVVQEPHDDRQKIAIALVTPTQERIALSGRDIHVVNKDLDIAVVKFKSRQNYRIANIRTYEFRQIDWVFVSGFPGKDRGKQRHFTIGVVQQQDETAFKVKDGASLREGRNLLYTNLSLPGMSGGAILDRQGRLVGLNTGAENVGITPNGEYQEINSGLALGIPMATVLGVTSRGQIPTARLQISNTPIPESSQSEDEDIQRIQLSALAKPNPTAKGKDWLDYGNLLWRGNQPKAAVTAFETAIKLLKRDPELPEQQEQLRIAYFGMGLAWWSNFQGSRSQNLQSAVVAFQQAVKVDPNFAPSSRYLGLSLGDLERYDEAVTAYKQAIALGKDNFVLYEELGRVLRHLKRYSEAIDAYNQAIKLQPNHHWAYTNRGVVYAVQKQYLKAIADYDRAIKLAPSDALNYQNRGFVYLLQKQYPQAIADYNRAIEFDSNNVTAYINRGSAYSDLKQYPQAIADFNQAIKLAPNNATAYYNRGIGYTALKQSTQAIADFNQAIKLNPQDPNVYIGRGVAYKDLKQYPQAIADLNQAIKLDRNNVNAYINRGSVYRNLKQYPQAIVDFNQAIKLDRNDANAYTGRGLVYEGLDRYPQAIADFSQAIKLDSKAALAYYGRGVAYFILKQSDRAMADLNQSIKLDRNYAFAYINRGLVYEELKQYPQAIADYDRAISIDPNHPWFYYNRGLVYIQQQQYPQAKADLQKAAKLYRTQNDTAGERRIMEILKQLS